MRVPWGNGRFARVLVYGLGVSGRAAARLLLSRGVSVLAVDRQAPEAETVTGLEASATGGAAFAVWPHGEPADLQGIGGIDGIGAIDGVVVSPGVPMGKPLLAAARREGLPVLAEVELAAPFLRGPIVAITGTNGKSTTTALTGALLSAAGFTVEVCGNIGEPLCDRVEGPDGRVFVVELSSFQIEGIETFKPAAAAFLNLTEDHLDRYAGLAAYADAKRRLFRDMEEDGVAVLNGDDAETTATATHARRRLFSRRGPVADGCWTDGERVFETAPGARDETLFSASDLQLPGVQNLENAMAAALLARAVDPLRVTADALRRGLAGFTGLPHRLARVGERGGVVYYDDSKGTNPVATAKSIEGFPDGSLHLILGGRNKGADLGTLTPLLRQKARRAYLIGESADDFARALTGAVPFALSGTLEQAVREAAEMARAGESVVLSPACASFDQFRSYADRGERFQALVRELLGGPHG